MMITNLLLHIISDCPFPSITCDLNSFTELISSYIRIKTPDYLITSNIWIYTPDDLLFAFLPSMVCLTKNPSENDLELYSSSINESKVLVNLGFDPSKMIDFTNFRDKNYDWKRSESKYCKVYTYGNNGVSSITSMLNSLSPNKLFCIIPLIISGNHVYSLSRQLLITNKTDPNEIFDFIEFRIELEAIKYNLELGDTIYFNLINITLSKSIDLDKFKSIKHQIKEYSNITPVRDIQSKILSSKYLPYSFELNKLGILVKKDYSNNNLYGDLYRYSLDIDILITDLKTNSRIGYVLKSGNILFKFEDVLTENILKRYINKHILVIDNNIECLLYIESIINSKPIHKNKSKNMIRDDKIISYDIETYRDINNNFIPYACGWYDGYDLHLYYLTDYNSSVELLLKSIEDIMIGKYKGYTVYMHNMQNFDGILLFKYLLTKYKVKPIIKDNKLMPPG